jgi:hypothetical protein
MSMSQVADELAIRRLGAAYSDACNRLCAEDVAALFAPDGTMGMAGGKTARGEKILKNFQIVLGAQSFLLQTLHSGLIDLDGDVARGRWWVSEILRPREGGGYLHNHGFYEDSYVRLPSGWRIQNRLFTLRLSMPLPGEPREGPAPGFTIGNPRPA